MALLAFDGFDNYATGTNDVLNRRNAALQWSAAVAVVVNSPGRSGVGAYAYLPHAAEKFVGSIQPLVSGIVGFAMQAINNSDPYQGLGFALMDLTANAPQLNFLFNLIAGSIAVYLGGTFVQSGNDGTGGIVTGGTLLGATANNAVTFGENIWNYYEVAATIAGSGGGAVELRVNGQVVLNLSGITTRMTAHTYFNGVAWMTTSNFQTTYAMGLDDFYLCDTTTGPGPYACNTFLGDVRVITLNTDGAGASTQWTPLTGTNWGEVAEARCDGDTTYNYTATVNNKDLFNFAPLTGTINAVIAVQTTGAYRKDNGGTREITQQLVSGATAVNGTTYSVPSSYVYMSDFWVTDPNTALAAWTVSAVNAVQAGYILSA